MLITIQDAAMPREKKQNGIGVSVGGPMYTLDGHGAHAVAHTLRAEGFDGSEDGTGRGTPLVTVGALAPNTGPKSHDAGNFHCNQAVDAGYVIPVGFQERPDLAHALRSNPSKADKPDSTTYIAGGIAVRRLTPLECERLQGFTDGWTEGESDSARYRMLGNAVCVNVAEWIGRRLVAVQREIESQ
jgi:DNA (cytosine-5)-methyltransferase 1